MSKVIIIEGPDGSGKTYLCEKLRDMFGYTIVHEGPPPAGEVPLYYYGHKLLKAFSSDKHTVFDRFHLGECVYAPLKRGVDTLGMAGVTLIERVYHAYGGQLVIALPSYHRAMANWSVKKFANDDYLMDQELYHQSYHLFARWTYRYLRYDFEEDSAYKYAAVLAGAEPTHRLPLGVIGSPRAQYLIVGERPGSRGLDLPFFGLDNSSGWINQSLWDAGFKEDQLAFVNAFKANTKATNFKEVVAALPCLKHIVCLGSFARRAISEVKLPFTELRHPSYEKRFQHHKQGAYVDKLRAVREVCSD